MIVPKVVGAPSGMTARFCPFCNNTLESFANMDVAQARVSTKAGLIFIAILGLICLGGYFYLMGQKPDLKYDQATGTMR